MADMCWNELKIIGGASVLDALLARVRRGPEGFGGTQLLLLESLAPCPTTPVVLTEEEEGGGVEAQPPTPSIEQ